MLKKSKFSDDPKAMHFQIRFEKDGCGSYYYFSVLSHKEIGSKAVEVANTEYLEKQYVNASIFRPYDPMKSAKVVQYDREKRQPLRGGIKFRIRLSFFEANFGRNKKVRDEFYVSDEIVKKQKA